MGLPWCCRWGISKVPPLLPNVLQIGQLVETFMAPTQSMSSAIPLSFIRLILFKIKISDESVGLKKPILHMIVLREGVYFMELEG